MISLMLAGFTDPPYSSGLLPMAFFNALCVVDISSTIADLPVPIAQIGSYAIIRFS